MTIVCSCHCSVESFDDTENLCLSSYDKLDDPCEKYVNYCKTCAEQARKDGIVITEFQYPEDRNEIYGEVNDEEASFYFTLNDFEQLVAKYGVQVVISRIRNETFEKLNEWFIDIGEDYVSKCGCKGSGGSMCCLSKSGSNPVSGD